MFRVACFEDGGSALLYNVDTRLHDVQWIFTTIKNPKFYTLFEMYESKVVPHNESPLSQVSIMFCEENLA
jgi:hypothetical protein